MQDEISRKNEAARELWAQIFGRAAGLPDAAMYDPSCQSVKDWEESVAGALCEAGWSGEEIGEIVAAELQLMHVPDPNSPGVGPGLEARLRRLSDRVSHEFSAIGETKQKTIEVAIDPRIGVTAALTNVIMTNEAILTVSSFLFRWCGLVA